MTITDIQSLHQQLPERLPKMVVFDLDYTCWKTWIDYTAGPPFTYDANVNVVYTKKQEVVRLFEDLSTVFALIKSLPDVKIGIASRTETDNWAIAALELFRIPEIEGSPTMMSQIDYFEAYPGSKIQHFKELEKKSGITCKDMVFFDDMLYNNNVTKLGVLFNLVDKRKGVTVQSLIASLVQYDKESRYVQTKLDFSKH